MKLSRTQLAWLIFIVVILVDQASKIWIKTHMALHDSYEVASWFYIYFIENNGMAYGIEIFNKMFLTIFRIFAVAGFSYALYRCIKREYAKGFIAAFALIIAGAIGNVIDSLFYGMIFSDSVGRVAEVFPAGGGYAPLFYGKVVDMFYFPLFSFNWPAWLPVIGGDEFIFFRPVFNVADSAVTVGFAIILLFYRNYISKDESEKTHMPIK